MKKFVSGLLVGIIIMSMVTGFAAGVIKSAVFNQEIKLEVDGNPISTDLVTVVLQGQVNGSNYVSARALAEAMSGTVTWDGVNKKILVSTCPKGTAVEDNGEYMYVGSKESNKFHLPTCTWAKKIASENLIQFRNRDDAVSAGYEPCGVCKP